MIYFGISHDDELVDLDGLSKVAKVRTLGACGSSFLSTLWRNDSAAMILNDQAPSDDASSFHPFFICFQIMQQLPSGKLT